MAHQHTESRKKVLLFLFSNGESHEKSKVGMNSLGSHTPRRAHRLVNKRKVHIYSHSEISIIRTSLSGTLFTFPTQINKYFKAYTEVLTALLLGVFLLMCAFKKRFLRNQNFYFLYCNFEQSMLQFYCSNFYFT